MRMKHVLVASVLALFLMGARHEEAEAAQCPSECRREVTMVPCSEEVCEVDGEVVWVVRRYWSNGAGN